MSRLKIDHITRYTYEGTVSRSHNEARMTPVSDDEQHVITAELAVKPSSASIHNYVDYFGTRVADFDVPHRHTVLEVRSSATVDVDRSAAAETDVERVGWKQLRDPHLLDTQAEYIAPTSLTAAGEELKAVAEQVRETAETPDAAAREILRRIAERVAYESGVTGVHTDADAVWSDAKGVCQDLSHVAIALLRELGIPARYVSGYIHPDEDAGIGQTVAGESHAWVEWWDGDWRAYDPTNHKALDDSHVKVGHGRDYRDVPPLKGMLTGGSSTESLDVTVEITRVS